jgi:Protein adenylyltransferase SelO
VTGNESRLMQTLRLDNTFVRELPIDPQDGPRRRQVHGAALHSRVEPTPVCAPRLIAHAREVASLLGIDAADVPLPAFAQVFAGNAMLDGMQPYAANYGGHQFGQWAGQLGDGRADETRLARAGHEPYSPEMYPLGYAFNLDDGLPCRFQCKPDASSMGNTTFRANLRSN